MINVVLSYIVYPLAMGKYFEAALRRRDDVNLVTVGPYTGRSIPWKHNMMLDEKYAVSPDVVLPQGSPPLPIGVVEAQLPTDFKPDLWLQIDAGWYLLEKPSAPCLNFMVATDPHCLNYDRQRNYADKFFNMQACYSKPGDIYLPYAYDPVWHSPIDPSLEQIYDVALIGLHYPNRNKLVQALRNRGAKVFYDIGIVYDEARQVYNQAPVGLNWSSLNDLTARVFELLGMKRLAVVNRVPDLERFFEPGKHLIVFDELDEAVQKTLWILDHPEALLDIAEAGHEEVKPHTWDARIEQILQEADLI